MQFPRYFVYILCVASCAVSLCIGVFIYSSFHSRTNVLGATMSMTILDKEYFEQISTPNFQHFYEMKPNSTVLGTALWLPERVEYTINQDGIHSTKDFEIPANSNTFRIMVLGDSFAFGQFVNTNENFSSRLSQMLDTSDCRKEKNFEVINLGVQGYDIGYTVEHFRRMGIKYQPDLVIWLVNTHNIVPLDKRSDRFTSLVAALPEEQRQRLKNGDDYMPLFVQAADEVIRSMGKDVIIQHLQAHMRVFNQVYKGPLVVLINDTMNDAGYIQYVQHALEQRPSTYIADSFPNLARIRGEHKDKHPNSVGHIAIATHIYKVLTAKQLISCSQE